MARRETPKNPIDALFGGDGDGPLGPVRRDTLAALDTAAGAAHGDAADGLIAAYLDGALDAAERAQFERRMANEAELRDRVAAAQTWRDSLDASQGAIPAALADAIADVPGPQPAVPAAPTTTDGPKRSLLDRLLPPRRWAAAAVPLVLVVAVVSVIGIDRYGQAPSDTPESTAEAGAKKEAPAGRASGGPGAVQRDAKPKISEETPGSERAGRRSNGVTGKAKPTAPPAKTARPAPPATGQQQPSKPDRVQKRSRARMSPPALRKPAEKDAQRRRIVALTPALAADLRRLTASSRPSIRGFVPPPPDKAPSVEAEREKAPVRPPARQPKTSAPQTRRAEDKSKERLGEARQVRRTQDRVPDTAALRAVAPACPATQKRCCRGWEVEPALAAALRSRAAQLKTVSVRYLRSGVCRFGLAPTIETQ